MKKDEIRTVDETAVNEALRHRNCPMHVRVVDTVPSTNTVLREAAEREAAEGEVLVALHQSAGRGRLGRNFHSPDGTGLYFSILLRPSFPLSCAGYLTPAAAVAVARVLETASSREMKIKWVNDIYADEKKVCGILTEAAVDGENDRFRYAIVGIGVNLFSPMGGFPAEIREVAGTVFDGSGIDASELLADILASFYQLYLFLPSHEFMEEYRMRSCLIGRTVTVTAGDVSCDGRVQTIDDEGGLVLRNGDGRFRTFRSGTVRLKGDPL